MVTCSDRAMLVWNRSRAGLGELTVLMAFRRLHRVPKAQDEAPT
jgi:hypothetical protein